MSFDPRAGATIELLESIEGDAAALVPTLMGHVERLLEIDEELANISDDAATWSEIRKAAAANGGESKLAEFQRVQEILSALRAEIVEISGLTSDDAAPLKREAGEIADKVRTLVKTVETAFGETGFTNAFMALVPKPEGSRLRASYKNLPTV